MTPLYLALAGAYAAIGFTLAHTFYLAINDDPTGDEFGQRPPVWAMAVLCLFWPLSWGLIFWQSFCEMRRKRTQPGCACGRTKGKCRKP